MYGYVLSSRSMTLNFGLYCLMRLFSSASASRSFSTRIVSRSAISRASEPVFASTQRDSRKYDRTRFRSERAFPTYTTFPAASLKRYTPGHSGSDAAFSRGSIKLKRRGQAFRPPLSSYGEFPSKEKRPADSWGAVKAQMICCKQLGDAAISFVGSIAHR